MGKRFEFVDSEGVMKGTQIVVDSQTGVQYLFVFWGNAGGMTTLVDPDGKPLLDPRYAKPQKEQQ